MCFPETKIIVGRIYGRDLHNSSSKTKRKNKILSTFSQQTLRRMWYSKVLSKQTHRRASFTGKTKKPGSRMEKSSRFEIQIKQTYTKKNISKEKGMSHQEMDYKTNQSAHTVFGFLGPSSVRLFSRRRYYGKHYIRIFFWNLKISDNIRCTRLKRRFYNDLSASFLYVTYTDEPIYATHSHNSNPHFLTWNKNSLYHINTLLLKVKIYTCTSLIMSGKQ